MEPNTCLVVTFYDGLRRDPLEAGALHENRIERYLSEHEKALTKHRHNLSRIFSGDKNDTLA